MPRKSRLRAKAASSSSSSSKQQWTALEESGVTRRLRVDESAKKKWDRVEPKVLPTSHVPIVVDESLTASDVLEIGTTLLDEFDPADLDLQYKLDASCLTAASDRAPGVSDEQLERYKKLLQSCGSIPLSFAAMKALLDGDDESADDDEEEERPHIDVEPQCALALAWFVDVMAPLPLIEAIKSMYYDAAIMLASHTAKSMAGEVWRHVAAVQAARKQDLADYMWHAAQLTQATDSKAKRVKREDV